MKLFTFVIAAFFSLNGFSQTNEEKGLLDRSAQIFQWEISNKFDSLETVFHDKMMVIGSTGEAQSKTAYLQRLQSGNFVHNNINIEKANAIVANNSATVFGEGKFDVTASGKKISLHLSYIEVFTRIDSTKPWVLLAIKANPMAN